MATAIQRFWRLHAAYQNSTAKHWENWANLTDPYIERLALVYEKYFRSESAGIIPLLTDEQLAKLAKSPAPAIFAGDETGTLFLEGGGAAWDELSDEIQSFIEENQKRWTATVTEISQASANAAGQNLSMQLQLKWADWPVYFREYKASAYGKEIVDYKNGLMADSSRIAILEEIKKGIENGLSHSEIRDKIRGVYNGWVRSRPMTIARTEVNSMGNSIQNTMLWALDTRPSETIRIWSTSRDSRVRHSHSRLEGEERPITQKFSNGLSYPGEYGKPAAEVINCRCVLKIKFASAEVRKKAQKKALEGPKFTLPPNDAMLYSGPPEERFKTPREAVTYLKSKGFNTKGILVSKKMKDGGISDIDPKLMSVFVYGVEEGLKKIGLEPKALDWDFSKGFAGSRAIASANLKSRPSTFKAKGIGSLTLYTDNKGFTMSGLKSFMNEMYDAGINKPWNPNFHPPVEKSMMAVVSVIDHELKHVIDLLRLGYKNVFSSYFDSKEKFRSSKGPLGGYSAAFANSGYGKTSFLEYNAEAFAGLTAPPDKATAKKAYECAVQAEKKMREELKKANPKYDEKSTSIKAANKAIDDYFAAFKEKWGI